MIQDMIISTAVLSICGRLRHWTVSAPQSEVSPMSLQVGSAPSWKLSYGTGLFAYASHSVESFVFVGALHVPLNAALVGGSSPAVWARTSVMVQAFRVRETGAKDSFKSNDVTVNGAYEV